METNECYVYFAFDGDDFDPDEITSEIGLKPTSVLIKGSKIPGVLPRSNCWKISTETIVNEIIDVEKMSQEIVDQLKDKIELINVIKKRYKATTRLQVVLWVTTDEDQTTPAIGFNVDIMKFLVATNSFIDIDTYKN